MNLLRGKVKLGVPDFSRNESDKFSEYESTVPEKLPYSNSTIEYNPEWKARIIACKNCKYRMESKIIAPICGICRREMVTVL